MRIQRNRQTVEHSFITLQYQLLVEKSTKLDEYVVNQSGKHFEILIVTVLIMICTF